MQNTALTLISDHFYVQVDPENASIQTLRDPSDTHGTNFVLNAAQAPEFKVEDSRFLGDLVFHVKHEDEDAGITMTSGLSWDQRSISQSDDCITIRYQGDSKSGNGFQGFSVTEKYSLSGSSRSVLDWTIKVTNNTSKALIFEDIGVPLLMNSLWRNDQTHNYEQSVHHHSFVAKHGSYIYWQRPNGEGPILVMATHRNTPLEFTHRHRDGEGVFGERLPHWGGLVEYYIHSAHVASARTDLAGRYLPASTLTLAPGASQEYGFSFRWAADYPALRDCIFASGGLDVVSMPGMVVPSDTTTTLALRCSESINALHADSGKKVQITHAGNSSGYEIYKLRFPDLGANNIVVRFSDSRWSVLQYYSIEPIEILIRKRAAFVAAFQQAKTTRDYNGAFLQWDMSTRKLVTWDDYPGGGPKEWMAGGSDDLGLAPAAFLSEKCITFPEQSEVSSIDYYIDHFLFGYLIGARGPAGERTFQIYRWFDGQDVLPKDTGIWRAYNYTHVANTFFNMYRIGKAYSDLDMRYDPLEYLTFAYEVLNAMYSKIPVPNPIGNAANELGLMGESTVPEIIDALESEGLSSQSQTLQGYMQKKLSYFMHVKYPFASEMTIDTTGFEAVYAFSAVHGTQNTSLIEKTQNASLASRGLQPLWYFYGSDNRMMGESYWNLGYETQLGAWQQQSYLIASTSASSSSASVLQRARFADSLRSTYGAYLAGWANINSGQISCHPENMGAASWLWQSEGGNPVWSWIPLIDRWWAWSGEADLGFWGALRTASVLVVHDPILGLYAYGGDVVFENAEYLIKPADGVQRRLTLFVLGNLTIEIDNARIVHAVVRLQGRFLELTLQSGREGCRPVVTLRHAPEGTFEACYAENAGEKVSSSWERGKVIFRFPKMPSAACKVIIQEQGKSQIC